MEKSEIEELAYYLNRQPVDELGLSSRISRDKLDKAKRAITATSDSFAKFLTEKFLKLF